MEGGNHEAPVMFMGCVLGSGWGYGRMSIAPVNLGGQTQLYLISCRTAQTLHRKKMLVLLVMLVSFLSLSSLRLAGFKYFHFYISFYFIIDLQELCCFIIVIHCTLVLLTVLMFPLQHLIAFLSTVKTVFFFISFL